MQHEFIERASKNLNEVQFETVHRSSTYPEYFGKPDILTYCEEVDPSLMNSQRLVIDV